MKRAFAINARDLLDSRRNGRSPTAEVAVSLTTGSVKPPVLYVRPDMPLPSLDWQMVVDLDCCVLADMTVHPDRVLDLCLDLAQAKPRSLSLHFADRRNEVHSVDIGSGTHRRAMPEHGIEAEHSFFWCPTDSGTPIARQLRKLLCTRKPRGLIA